MSRKLVENLKGALGDAVRGQGQNHGDEWVLVDREDLPRVARHLRDREGYRLFTRRAELLEKLRAEFRAKRRELEATTKYDLA